MSGAEPARVTWQQPNQLTGGLHPATELVLLGCGLLLVYGVPSPVVPAALLVFAGLAAAFSPRVGFGRWLLTLTFLAGPMLVMVGIIQGLFYPGADVTVLWEWGPAAVTVEGLSVAAQLWLRVAAMIGLCALFGFATDASRVFDGMIALRAPLTLAYICSTAMSLIPLLGAQIHQGLQARAARGWPTDRLITRMRLLPGILTSVIITSLTQLDQRHDALAQRGFGSSRRPTPARSYPNGTLQRVARWVAPMLVVLLVAAALVDMLPLPSAREILEVLGV